MKTLYAIIIAIFMANTVNAQSLSCGADQPNLYLANLQGKKVGLVANQSSRANNMHLLDYLLSEGINVAKVFTPEHGFRGDADAGEVVKNGKDSKTGTPIVSLYGKNKKPTAAQLADIDIVVFDLQDVGARFYTYYGTMYYVMQTCAETSTPLLVLDRPNPNGDYIAGPILDMKHKSFVGMLPIPVVHGCTLGELALMINGEDWLNTTNACPLEIIPVANYTHQTPYVLPIKPSPNLPNNSSVRLYPSICFFEATSMSVGRGTDFPFQVVGYPNASMGNFKFTPRSIPGASKHPKMENKLCYGTDYRDSTALLERFSLEPFISYYNKFDDKDEFLDRRNWFTLLIGNTQTIKDIAAGKSWQEIEQSWLPELRAYNKMRKQYLLYPDSFKL